MKATLGICLLTLAVLCTHARADVTVVEYRHSGFDHYFVTPVADEIAKLDARTPPFELWSRTGRTFRAFDSGQAGTVAICRFFNESFAPKSSHFYAPRGLGCESTLANFKDWRLEDDKLFAAMLPDASGACPGGTVALYRLYNDGRSGAPNHRFVGNLADRQAMLDKGYVPEGAGIGIGMCVPGNAGPARATATGVWRGVTDRGQPIRFVVFDDRSYYFIYSDVPGAPEAGVATGTLTYSGNTWTSTDAVIVGMTAELVGASGTLRGTFDGDVLYVNLGSTGVVALFDAAHDAPVDVAALAGEYVGASGHFEQLGPHGSTTATLDSQGRLSIRGVECRFVAALAPQPAIGVMTFSFTTINGVCANGGPKRGIALYDAATRRLALVSEPFANGLSGIKDMFGVFATRQ